MKKNEIQPADVEKILKDYDIEIAYSKREAKRMCLDLNLVYTVSVTGKGIIYKGRDLKIACEKYNSITETYKDISKNFVI